ncbi:MAG: hypothetical protein A3B23_00680 [Candidatus Colwellbacteria bacterium RIFCSPLOWO2_01_FULL_48_10]|uniref:UDP-N-acetylglucosamine--N-acetylmuramyl-(pentapeptide) pyrophosphoryl-undecaprenol N-acetylglucosamine transferase n=1 Tax=Candidatus Colwellbacteria bacterium RIFCSPLOWO2_01_FULL_48_10 TaxID=1797690 RepID=A0A1G1Z4P3_9BACT|nr:MAG: hypothetical protein A3B23_00680 [Candidatus Colwellbacteria bacterium RIFCSPLOWO2_01_FULL_48_10]
MLTGGDNGGRIYPLIAVVSELQTIAAKDGINLKISYLGAFGLYKEFIKANNIRVHSVAAGGLRGFFGFLQALWWTYWIMPDVVLSDGGLGSFAVVLAARFYRVPVVVHECNAAPDASNISAVKSAKAVSLAFAGAAQYLPAREKPVLIGNPVRHYILPKLGETDQAFAKRTLGFDSSKPLIFVNGGSQCAPSINNFIVKNLPYVLEIAQVLHQTGRENYETVLNQVSQVAADIPEDLAAGYKAVDYFERDIKNALIGADVVVARSGAGSIFEIAAFGKPSILIPMPGSSDDHQRLNAYEYSSTGAAIVIDEENLLSNFFINKLQSLLADPIKMAEMSAAASTFYKPGAAADLARIVLESKA